MNHIELAGVSYPIQFGYGALMDYEALTGRSALALLEGRVEPGITECFTLIACGLKNGSDAAGHPVEFTAKGVARLCDQMKPDEVGTAITAAMEMLRASFATEDSVKKNPVKLARAERRKAS